MSIFHDISLDDEQCDLLGFFNNKNDFSFFQINDI